VSAQTYITPIMLAILAYLTFQLLYDPVANGLVDVANLRPRRNRVDNFNAVSLSLSVGKKSPGETLETPSGYLPLFFFA